MQGGKTPEGQPEDWAPDLAQSWERLQPDWIIDWLASPQAQMPGTGMPAFFEDEDFPLPPNYRPEDDPYGDAWASLSPEQRRQLGEWKRVYYAMTANLDWNIGRLLVAVDDAGLSEDTIVGRHGGFAEQVRAQAEAQAASQAAAHRQEARHKASESLPR